MRRYDWQIQFAEFVRERLSMPFAWGSNDCCTFAASAIEAITGINPMADVTPYDSEMAAARLILRAGDLQALASQFLGAPLPPLMAAVGDVVLVMNAGRELLAVCNGGTALAPGALGIEVVGMESAVAAWRV